IRDVGDHEVAAGAACEVLEAVAATCDGRHEPALICQALHGGGADAGGGSRDDGMEAAHEIRLAPGSGARKRLVALALPQTELHRPLVPPALGTLERVRVVGAADAL